MRKTKRSKFAEYERPPGKDVPDLWMDVANAIEKKLPKIVYFPTFLVDMPQRIYLEAHEGESATNRYYRAVMQDVLSSVDPNLSIEKHVIQRIQGFKASEKSPFWLSLFFGAPSKSHVDSVFQKIANALTKEVIVSWSKVFNRPSGAKTVLVEWNVDTQRNDLPYASFLVSDGDARYLVSERSLGFRWFFSFLLFTSFKQAVERPTLFLFDEPAANLHARAQAELLTNFARTASGRNRIIYSTHSHHMIDPKWLSSAYIVENTAIDYDSGDAFELNSGPTNVKATPYRDFVSQYPTRVSYFQPVLEKLEYVSPEILGSPPYVIVEGITDYYAFRYASSKAGKTYSFNLMPGSGSGSSGPLLSYLLGRGERFLVLLDDDKSGRDAAERYKSGWFLTPHTVMTLGDIESEYKGLTLEKLLSDETRTKISEYLQISTAANKKDIGAFLAEICSHPSNEVELSESTMKALLIVLEALESSLKAVS